MTGTIRPRPRRFEFSPDTESNENFIDTRDESTESEASGEMQHSADVSRNWQEAKRFLSRLELPKCGRGDVEIQRRRRGRVDGDPRGLTIGSLERGIDRRY